MSFISKLRSRKTTADLGLCNKNISTVKCLVKCEVTIQGMGTNIHNMLLLNEDDVFAW